MAHRCRDGMRLSEGLHFGAGSTATRLDRGVTDPSRLCLTSRKSGSRRSLDETAHSRASQRLADRPTGATGGWRAVPHGCPSPSGSSTTTSPSGSGLQAGCFSFHVTRTVPALPPPPGQASTDRWGNDLGRRATQPDWRRRGRRRLRGRHPAVGLSPGSWQPRTTRSPKELGDSGIWCTAGGPRRALIYNLLSAITFLPHRRAHRLQPSPGSSPSPWPSPSPRATSAKSPPLISSLEIREILYTACFGLGPLAPLGIAPSRDATNPQGKMHPCRWVSGINAGAVVARSVSNSPFSGHSALLAIAAPGIHTERRWGEKRGS